MVEFMKTVATVIIPNGKNEEDEKVLTARKTITKGFIYKHDELNDNHKYVIYDLTRFTLIINSRCGFYATATDWVVTYWWRVSKNCVRTFGELADYGL